MTIGSCRKQENLDVTTPLSLSLSHINGLPMLLYQAEIGMGVVKHFFKYHPEDIPAMFIEIKARKQKWLLQQLHQPYSNSDQYFLPYSQNALKAYFKYEKVTIAGDFNG